MAYCTQDDILNKLPEDDLVGLTDDVGNGVVDSAVVDSAIADADEEIDAFVSLRYSLPLSVVPGLLKRISAHLAVCGLYGRRPHLEMPKSWSDRCGHARRLLEKISQGKITLGATEPAQSSGIGITTTKTKDDRVFTTGRVSDNSSGSLDNF